MKMHHIYPAVLQKEETKYVLTFPDFPEINLSFEEVEQETILISAREALAEQIFKMESENQELPGSSDLFSLGKKENEIVLLIGVHMRRYYMEQKAIKKTLTIPNWLNDLAEEEGINFSHLLQQSLVEELRFREGMVRGFHRGGHPHFHQHEDREGLREHMRSRGSHSGHRERSEADCDCGGHPHGERRHFGRRGHHHGPNRGEFGGAHRGHFGHEGHHHGHDRDEELQGPQRGHFEGESGHRRPGRPPRHRDR